MSRRLIYPFLLGLVLLWGLPAFAQGEDEEPGGDEESTETLIEEADEEESSEPEEDVEMSIYRELKTVEAQVDDLKEKVFRSKARLLLLEEKVIRGVVSGAKAVVRHLNQLGPSYALESITYYFDGNPIYQKTNVGTKGALAKEKKVELWEANVPPGNHTLSVTGLIKGKGTGLFAYLSDYSFEFSSSYSFVAQDGKTTRVDSVLLKKGGAAADWLEAPTIEFRLLDSDKGGKGKAGGDDAADAGSEGSGT
jgi:hypothetical protein